MIGLGYEGMTIDEFCAQVTELTVSLVADFRLNALSRPPGFSQNSLRAALAGIGVNYLHLPALGNPRDDRSGFQHPETRDDRKPRRKVAADTLDIFGDARD